MVYTIFDSHFKTCEAWLWACKIKIPDKCRIIETTNIFVGF